MVACPYGAISLDTQRHIMIHCNLCEGDPECVKFCPTKALDFVRMDMADMPRRRQMAMMLSEAVAAARVS
jgi:Fe-S-cluster-containing hydrogenase component 2